MRVELPNGDWADFRDLDDMTAGDAFAVAEATTFRVKDGALEEVSMGLQHRQMAALITNILTGWSVKDRKGEQIPLPQFDKTGKALRRVPLKHYNELSKAAKPYLDAVNEAGKAEETSETESTPTSSPETPPTWPTETGRETAYPSSM